ncbi:MAG: hypothetical protein RJA98_1076 [Pseudomonadota bacterium]|jgi:hypothetical protein
MSAPTQTLLAGLPVVVGGTSLIMPPLSAREARLHWDRLRALERGEEENALEVVALVVHACLQRNYPAITLDEVEEAVDMDNMSELLSKASGQGAFRRWCEQQAALQAADAGNVATQLQTPVTAGTGEASMPPSPPSPAGDLPTSTS